MSAEEMVAPPGWSASMSSVSPTESLAAASTTSICAKSLPTVPLNLENVYAAR